MGKAKTTTTQSAPLKRGVDMNLSGAWRSLGTFEHDLDKLDLLAVLEAAQTIVLNQADGDKGKLRLTDPTQVPPMVLMYWSKAKGWEESRHVAG